MFLEKIHILAQLGRRHSMVQRYCPFFRSTPSRSLSFECLTRRSILKISGPETRAYLQGMITNNIQIFDDASSNHNCIYALLLNPQGRVLYDCLLYKLGEEEFLLEYDSAAFGFIKLHLDIYRMRKKVTVAPLKNISVWVALDSDGSQIKADTVPEKFSSSKGKKILLSVPDPRLDALGFRLLASEENDSEQRPNDAKPSGNYDLLRYRLGIGEGVIDHPPGICLPFETNADFLNGISFTKGCYVGQELTARTHYTGVIRKRIMPVTLHPECEEYPKFPVECTVLANKHKVGKFHNHIGKYGLAILKVEESLKASAMKLDGFDIQIEVMKPEWWPEE